MHGVKLNETTKIAWSKLVFCVYTSTNLAQANVLIQHIEILYSNLNCNYCNSNIWFARYVLIPLARGRSTMLFKIDIINNFLIFVSVWSIRIVILWSISGKYWYKAISVYILFSITVWNFLEMTFLFKTNNTRIPFWNRVAYLRIRKWLN